MPLTVKEYTDAGLPWFEYYGGDATALSGGGPLQKLKSILRLAKAKGDVPLPENEPIAPELVVKLRAGLTKDQVREGSF